METKEQEKISRKIAYILRHNPAAYNVEMNNQGQVKISEILQALHISREVFNKIVEEDNKQRYVIVGEKVFAAQGHSIPNLNIPMKKLTNNTENFYHGTKTNLLHKIMSEGLLPQSREFVHLSKNIETAVNVANRRKGNSVILEINSKTLETEEINIFEAANGVILVSYVPANCLHILKYL